MLDMLLDFRNRHWEDKMSSTNLDRSLVGDLLGGASLSVVLNVTPETCCAAYINMPCIGVQCLQCLLI